MLIVLNWLYLKTRSQQSNAIEVNLPYVIYCKRKSFITISFITCLAYSPLTLSEVSDVYVSDVTTRSFSVVWFSNSPVIAASVRIFSDIDGLDDITETVSRKLISSSNALALGLVKIDITGVSSDTSYYIETMTESTNEEQVFPSLYETLIEVHTAFKTTKFDSQNEPITNDLISESIIAPNNFDVPSAGLILINIPDSPYPISSFVEENTGFSEAHAILDLNNFFNSSAISAHLTGGEIMKIKKYRGLICNDEDQILEQIRKVPEHLENPAITELEQSTECHLAQTNVTDLNCNNRIGLTDLAMFSSRFNATVPDCRFNPDYDFNQDSQIDDLDYQALIAVLGASKQ